MRGESITLLFSEGEERTLYGYAMPLHDDIGEVRGSVGAFLDITEQKRAEETLRNAMATLEQKVQERTAELAQRAAQLRALAGELTLSEQRERRRMAKILHDHLQQLLVGAKFRVTILARAGDDVVRQAAMEVEGLLEEAISSSRSLTADLSPPILHEAGLDAGLQWLVRWIADKHGLFVELVMEEKEIPLADDIKALLFESVRELLFNAAKHSQSRSATINVRRVDGQVQVSVSDNGVGFDLNAIPQVGETGGGFGLFSIRERLDLVGGRLEIDSAPGEGSRFVLLAPLAFEAALPATETLLNDRGAEAPAIIPGSTIRVLLADDHVVVREGLAQLLRNEPDIEVVGGAADGREAVELAGRLLPDVILMDLSMPELNGIDATREIHSDHPDIRIIGLSMYEEADRAQAMRDAGAVNYLSKSGPSDTLLAAIRGAFIQAKVQHGSS